MIGAGNADDEVEGLAEEVGTRLAEAGATVVCGGLGGVMEAAARGARRAGGDVIGIVPSSDPAQANEHVTHVVASGVGYARNLCVVGSADAVIAIGGEWGTLTEMAYARDLGRRVIVLRGWTVSGVGPMDGGPGIERVDTPAVAVELALREQPAAR